MPLRMESLRSIASETFTGDYQAIGEPLSNSAVKIIIKNFTNQPVYVSIDGFTDHEYIDIESILVIDSNPSIEPFSIGTQFYVKGFSGDGNEGYVFLSDYYNSLK